MTNDCDFHVSLEPDENQAGFSLVAEKYKTTSYNVFNIPTYPRPLTFLIVALPKSEFYWPLHGYFKYDNYNMQIFTNEDGEASASPEFSPGFLNFDGVRYASLKVVLSRLRDATQHVLELPSDRKAESLANCTYRAEG